VVLQSSFHANVIQVEQFTLDSDFRSRSFCVAPTLHHAVAGQCAGVGGQQIGR